MEGLIPAQIGLASHVRPQGAIRLSWEAFVQEQVERDDLIRWAQSADNAPLEVKEEKKRRSYKGFFSGLIP